MTAAALTPSKEYIENGVTLAYAVPFRFRAATHIKAQRISAAGVVTELAYGTDYSVTGGETDAGGTLTVSAAGVAGTRLRIRRETPRAQDMDYTTGDNFPAESHEAALDKAILIDQEQDQKIDDTAARALLVPDGQQAPAVDLSGLIEGDLLQYRSGKLRRFVRESFAGKYFAGDGSGVPIPASGTGNDTALRSDLANNLLGTLLLAWKAAGVGAVIRTLWARLNDLPVSVKDFGAVGDGVENDAAALQAAFSSGAKAIMLPFATYRITAGVSIPDGVLIEGNGSTINSTMAGASINAIALGSGCVVRNLKLVGPGGAAYVAENNGFSCKGTNNSPAAPTYVTAPVFENVEVSGYGAYGIRLQYCIGSENPNVYVHDCGYAGVGGMSCEDVWFPNYRAKAIGPGNLGDAYGIFFDRLETGNETVEPRSYRCGATNVDIQNVNAVGGNGQACDSHGGVDILFSGIATNCDVGFAFTASSIAGASALAPIRCKADMTINGPHNSYGFFIVGALSGESIVQYAEDCVANVVVEGHGRDDGTVTDGSIGATSFYGTKGLKIRGQFKNNESCCIYLNRDNYAFDIQATFIDPHADNFGAPSAIRVVANNNRGYISGVYRYENAALGSYVAVNSVRIEAGLTGLDLDFGPSSFIGIDATHLTFTPLTTAGVRYSGMQKLTGNASISVASGGADGILDVAFAKRLPYTPHITVTLDRPFNGGGKFPIAGIDTVVAPSATGFRIYVLPADGTTWSASGTIGVKWIAQ